MASADKPSITHIALKVEDLETTAALYETVFGFERTEKKRKNDSRTTVHLSDGSLDLAITHYDNEDTPVAQMMGHGPRIGHFGIEVDDVDATVEKLKTMGCEILTPPGILAVKFRIPGAGVTLEIGARGFFKHPRDSKFDKMLL